MRGMELKNEIEEARNYIFYVSDYIDVSAGHAWKMDCRQAMTEQMVQNLPNCKVMKYTEYHGERLDADSVGILFPSKMWGISLAVYAFLQNLRVSASTYVYAVAMGEVLSAEVNGTANVRMETLGQFQDIFERRRLGDISDIYIRCIDYKREFTTTEEKLMRSVTTAERIADGGTAFLQHEGSKRTEAAVCHRQAHDGSDKACGRAEESDSSGGNEDFADAKYQECISGR
jgi:hypothetical protein